jgi:hypothetical protein
MLTRGRPGVQVLWTVTKHKLLAFADGRPVADADYVFEARPAHTRTSFHHATLCTILRVRTLAYTC